MSYLLASNKYQRACWIITFNVKPCSNSVKYFFREIKTKLVINNAKMAVKVTKGQICFNNKMS